MENNHSSLFLSVKVGIVVITLIIVGVWVVNIKNVWQNVNERTPASNKEEWKTFQEEMDRSLDGIKNNLNKLNTSVTTSTVPVKDDPSQQTVDDVLKKTWEIASSSLPLSKPELLIPNCPAWVNCMPTFDSPPSSCAVPPGCEDITQIAY